MAFSELEKRGFAVYFDTRGTLVGEQFLTVIIDHLRQCDAVLGLISAHSSASAWCQAELYYAHALRRVIVPIRLCAGEKIALRTPLDLLQRERQFVPLERDEDRWLVLRAMEERFRVVAMRARWRWTRRSAAIVVIAGLFAWSLHSGFAQLLREHDRRALLSRIDRSQAVLRTDVVEPQIEQFKDDVSLLERLLTVADDRERPMHARLNARILGAAIGSRPRRWYLENLVWSNSIFRSGELTDVTFRTGSLNAVELDDVTLSGVVWNEGPGRASQTAAFTAEFFFAHQCHRR